MKILVFAHQLEVGGTQTNAIELAAALRDAHGHDVVLFATPGPMLKLVEQKALRFVAAPEGMCHPSPSIMKALRALVRRERPDVLHAWDWWQCLDAYYSVHLCMGVPMVVTDMMSQGLVRLLPKRLPTTFGVPELVERARAAGRSDVEFLAPPVDVRLNSPGAADPAPLRQRFSVRNGEVLLVIVSRLASWLKGESLQRTVKSVQRLGRELPVRLVIVGDGSERSRLESMADSVNAELGREAISFAGEMMDPRPAYAAADIVIGMGGSALRGLAFGKPLIVVGEQGFAAPFTPETAPSFLHGGMYGLGDGDPMNQRLTGHIRDLAGQPAQFESLGRFGRQFVIEHFAIESVAGRLNALLERAAQARPNPAGTLIDGLRTAMIYLRERRFLARRPRVEAPTSGR